MYQKVKFHKPQKAHLHPVREVCVQNPPMGFRDLHQKPNADRHTDIRGDAITPRPNFVGRGIKREKTMTLGFYITAVYSGHTQAT